MKQPQQAERLTLSLASQNIFQNITLFIKIRGLVITQEQQQSMDL
jgi:hypothetical protein